MKDNSGREINYLRISLTKNCNLKCIYCLPEKMEHIKEDELSLEDILKIVKNAIKLGINKIRLTGGEPLLRKDLIEIVKEIKLLGIDEIYITTNGILLEEKLENLKKAGLKGINISLDTLEKELFKKITRGGSLDKVISGLLKAKDMGFEIKINSVIMKGINENSIVDLGKITKKYNIDVRFIELMPMGEGKKYIGINNKEIYKELEEIYGFQKDFFQRKGVSEYYRLVDGKGRIGFISPINNCFCENCNKIRLTSTGEIKRCLNMKSNINIKDYLKSDEEIENILKIEINKKPEKHLFGKENIDEERKNMNEIGG